jgi:hypothetical protein
MGKGEIVKFIIYFFSLPFRVMIWKIQGYRSRRRIVKIFNKYKKEE